MEFNIRSARDNSIQICAGRIFDGKAEFILDMNKNYIAECYLLDWDSRKRVSFEIELVSTKTGKREKIDQQIIKLIEVDTPDSFLKFAEKELEKMIGNRFIEMIIKDYME